MWECKESLLCYDPGNLWALCYFDCVPNITICIGYMSVSVTSFPSKISKNMVDFFS